jgi:hypothetical protein
LRQEVLHESFEFCHGSSPCEKSEFKSLRRGWSNRLPHEWNLHKKL